MSQSQRLGPAVEADNEGPQVTTIKGLQFNAWVTCENCSHQFYRGVDDYLNPGGKPKRHKFLRLCRTCRRELAQGRKRGKHRTPRKRESSESRDQRRKAKARGEKGVHPWAWLNCPSCGERKRALLSATTCDDCRNAEKTSVQRLLSKRTQLRKSMSKRGNAGKVAKLRGRLKRYGLTPDDFLALLSTQEGACAVCQRVVGDEKLVIDHDHRTGKVRGLLCSPCNTALGFFRDDPATMDRAAAYLRLHT